MKEQWFEVGSSTLSGLWADKIDRSKLKRHGGLGESEWFCPATGAAFALIADGEWRTGGQYRLFYLAPNASTAVNVDAWMWPVDKQRFSNTDSMNYVDAKRACAAFIRNMLGSSTISGNPPAE